VAEDPCPEQGPHHGGVRSPASLSGLRRDGTTLQSICDQLAARGAHNGKGRPFAPA
jgi:hypothetical protein